MCCPNYVHRAVYKSTSELGTPLYTGQPAGSQWVPLQRGSTVIRAVQYKHMYCMKKTSTIVSFMNYMKYLNSVELCVCFSTVFLHHFWTKCSLRLMDNGVLVFVQCDMLYFMAIFVQFSNLLQHGVLVWRASPFPRLHNTA